MPSIEKDGSDFLVAVVNKRDWLTPGYTTERDMTEKERGMRREAIGDGDGRSGRGRESL